MVSRADRSATSNWWWTIDKWLLSAFLLLIGLGAVLSFAASPAVANRLNLNDFHFVQQQFIFIIPALFLMIGVSFLSQRHVRRLAALLFIGSLVMMVLVLFVGTEVKGSHRWLRILGFSIQPSEFLKPAFVIMCAWLFSENEKYPEISGNLLAIMLLGLVVVLLVAQPDLGQTVLISATWGIMFFAAGMPWIWVIALGSIAIVGASTAYFVFPHVAGRIDRFLTGEGDTFQVDTAREAIIRGGWFGQGPGEGTIKRILPDSHTDFVYAVAAEEFGVITCLFILALFAFVALRGLAIAHREDGDFARLAIAGLVIVFAMQSVINMGVNVQLLPAKGMTLPFISYGGSSLLAMGITMGMVLALTRKRPLARVGDWRRNLPQFQVAQ